jgi:hypothetical protein
MACMLLAMSIAVIFRANFRIVRIQERQLGCEASLQVWAKMIVKLLDHRDFHDTSHCCMLSSTQLHCVHVIDREREDMSAGTTRDTDVA